MPVPRDDLFALGAALSRLAAVDPQAAKRIELRHFAGLSGAEATQAHGISLRTADRLGTFARAWRRRALADTAADPKSEKKWRESGAATHS